MKIAQIAPLAESVPPTYRSPPDRLDGWTVGQVIALSPLYRRTSLEHLDLWLHRAAVPGQGIRFRLEFLREGQHPIADDLVCHRPG